MKKFLIIISIFAVILYGLAWGLDYAISKGLYQMDDYRFISWREIEKGKIDADIIIMGNSRALSHFEPWTIDSITGLSCYNLGIGGYSITVEDLKYKYYRLYNNKPKFIIQQIDHHTLRNDYAPHQHQSEQFLPLLYDKHMHSEMRRVGYSWLDVHCPLYRYWGYQMVIKNGMFEFFGLKHYVNDPSRQGLHYETGPWDGAELAKKDTILAGFNEKGKMYFENYMQRCADDGIKVILVNSPNYIGATNKTIGKDEVNAYFDSIASVYNTVYWNYNESYDICNDTANFVVSFHMNPEATHRFSIDFANRLNEELKNKISRESKEE